VLFRFFFFFFFCDGKDDQDILHLVGYKKGENYVDYYEPSA